MAILLVFARAALTQTPPPSAPVEIAPSRTPREVASSEKNAQDEQAVAIRLEGNWAGCPTPTDFFARLAQRAPGVRLTRPGEPGWVFVAGMARAEPNGVRGHLRVQDLEGGVLERDVSGASCAEVAEALTLIGAVTIRPGIAVDYDSGGRPRAAASTSLSAAPLGLGALPPAVPVPGWSFALRGVGLVRSNVVPIPLYGVGLGAELAHEGSSAWRPAVALAAAATLEAIADTGSALSRTELTAQLFFGQVAVSPLALRTGAVELRPYAAFELGVLTASGQGEGLTFPRQSRELWVAAALLAQGDVILGESWRIGAYAGAQLHPVRYLFQMTPVDVYRTSFVGVSAGALISVRMN
jgi:hypothetical protein